MHVAVLLHWHFHYHVCICLKTPKPKQKETKNTGSPELYIQRLNHPEAQLR